MGGKTSSASHQNSTTQNTDKRIANDGGLVAQDGGALSYSDNSTFAYQEIDAGAVEKAFKFASDADAIQGEGLTKLLSAAEGLAGMAERMASKSADSATGLASKFQDNVMTAYSNGVADKAGAFDQKTIVILAATAAGAMVLLNRRK